MRKSFLDFIGMGKKTPQKLPDTPSTPPTTSDDVATTLGIPNIITKSTDITPAVEYDSTTGTLSIIWRSTPELSTKFWSPIRDIIKTLAKNKALKIIVFKLEYFNTSSSKQILDLLRYDTKQLPDGSLIIEWHYEKIDGDMLEAGEDYQSLVGNLPCMKSWEYKIDEKK